MIKNILTNLKIEQLNAMQEAAIDTWKEGKDLIFYCHLQAPAKLWLICCLCYRV